ncbi:unnamed protein product [Closterium sp. Naga37s-1]|nr:unnamed protein product [Closterium sp. Naga37s-1]
MDATKEVPIVGNEGDNAAAAADIDLNLDDFVVDMEINGSEAENEDEAGSDEGVSNETGNIAVKLQTQLTKQHILIGEQRCRIQNLEADSFKLQALIEKLNKEVQLIPKENTTSSLIEDLHATLKFVQDQLKTHETHISQLQAQYRDEARVVAATLALDDTASKLVYANKRHAEANGRPFGWEEFKAAMLTAFLVQPPALEVRSRLENIQCGDQPVREYAKEFEKTLSLLKTALPESEVIHQFFKGLPEHIKRVHVVKGEHQWKTYKECKEQVISTDVHFRAYLDLKSTRAQQQPSAEGTRGGGSRTQAPRGCGSWKRPYQQKGESFGTQSMRPDTGHTKDPQDADKPPAGCHICGKLGHKAYQCHWRKSVKNSGKPNQGKKPDGSGPSGSKDFQKPN